MKSQVKFLKSVRYNPNLPPYKLEFPDLSVSRSVPISNSIPANGFRKSMDDYKWRKNIKETQEAIQSAELKKKQIAPLYNKGPLMYITNGTDNTSLGKK